MDEQSCYYRDLLKRYILSISLRDQGLVMNAETAQVIPDKFKIFSCEKHELDELFDEIRGEWDEFVWLHNETYKPANDYKKQ